MINRSKFCSFSLSKKLNYFYFSIIGWIKYDTMKFYLFHLWDYGRESMSSNLSYQFRIILKFIFKSFCGNTKWFKGYLKYLQKDHVDKHKSDKNRKCLSIILEFCLLSIVCKTQTVHTSLCRDVETLL